MADWADALAEKWALDRFHWLCHLTDEMCEQLKSDFAHAARTARINAVDEAAKEVDAARTMVDNARIVIKAQLSAMRRMKEGLEKIANEQTKYTTGEGHARAIAIASETLEAVKAPKEGA